VSVNETASAHSNFMAMVAHADVEASFPADRRGRRRSFQRREVIRNY